MTAATVKPRIRNCFRGTLRAWSGRQNPSIASRAELTTRIRATSHKALPLKPVLFAAAISLRAGLVAFCQGTHDRDQASLGAKYLDAPTDRLDLQGVRLHVRDSLAPA
jgi:hypothetical protein